MKKKIEGSHTQIQKITHTFEYFTKIIIYLNDVFLHSALFLDFLRQQSTYSSFSFLVFSVASFGKMVKSFFEMRRLSV